MSINYGMYYPDTYTKYVTFAKAVLWKTRELSVPVKTMNQIEEKGIKKMEFIDVNKREKWTFSTDEVIGNMKLKKVGQEEQFYFPISLAKKSNLSA